VASSVDICNLALAHLGDEALVSAIEPPDGSVQAMHCQRFYPIARDALLSMHPWGFATRRAALVAIVNAAQPPQWAFSYALPNLCLAPKRVLLPDSPLDAEGEDFLIETLADGTPVLYTNAEYATLVFTASVSDTTKFTPLAVNALARLLASYLAGPIIKGDAGKKESAAHYKAFLQIDFPLAAGADANAQKRSDYPDFTPSSIGARA
jgi:hypothetical protein